MHAQRTNGFARNATPLRTGMMQVADLRPGAHFVRATSPSEVLALLSSPGTDTTASPTTLAVVIAVNQHSIGHVPGQMVKLARNMLVRAVHEARAAVFALEQ
jgi:hypothetical protein